MIENTRSLCLDICDYQGNVVCNLYDNHCEVQGQAVNVFVSSERNGWKELSFSLPGVCISEEGVEENYRLDYLIADYRIRLIDDFETDWYIISEPKIIHNNDKEKTVDVVAGHVSQLLKTKNLGLEFSDEEGNNVGTCEQLLTTILEDTGWHVGNVARFMEDDGSGEKSRSLVAPAKTGAFKLVTDMCELFEAKAIFHGEGTYIDDEGIERTGYTIDVLPMNPFSREITYEGSTMIAGKTIELTEGQIPEAAKDGKALEMHYSKNISNIERVLNTENIVTRLYAYGNYGDMTGMASLQTAKHNEYEFTVENNYPAGTEFRITDNDGAHRFFTSTEAISAGTTINYSELDLTSRSYVFNTVTDTAYNLYKEPNSNYVDISPVEPTAVQNWFSSVTDFTYYEDIGLLTDSMKQTVAKFQRESPALLEYFDEQSNIYNKKEQELSEVAESYTGFAKLNVARYETVVENNKKWLKVVLDKTANYPDGIIYRTDYDKAERNYFSWRVAQQLKTTTGDSVDNIGSILFIIHDTIPVTWERVYLKQINELYHYEIREGINVKVCDNYDYGITEGKPEYFTVWAGPDDIPALKSSDRLYLFCSNSMTGKLGEKQVADESAIQSLSTSTKVGTKYHPTYFEEKKTTESITEYTPHTSTDALFDSYGWCYVTNPETLDTGDLYFCESDYGLTWKPCWCQETMPTAYNGGYFFDVKYKVLYHGENGSWVKWETSEQERIARAFSLVNYFCLRRDMLYKGLRATYTYNASTVLPIGNYAISSGYGFYWTFTTDRIIPAGNALWYSVSDNRVCQIDDKSEHVLPVEVVSDVNTEFTPANILTGVEIAQGSIISDGTIDTNVKKYTTSYIKTFQDETYDFSFSSSVKIAFYTEKKVHIETRQASGNGSFIASHHANYMRVEFATETIGNSNIHIQGYDNKFFVDTTGYTILHNVVEAGDRDGINNYTKIFADLADETYTTYLGNMLDAQKRVKEKELEMKTALGDIYREGWWQEQRYTGGDEQKLYSDALDNLKEVSKPEATYTIGFLDLYDSNRNMEYSVNGVDAPWPDIHVTDAIHLIDKEIDVNLWGYIDRLNKCYDKPWETTLEINTNMSLMGQHDFSDVMEHIAQVANETKAKQSLYMRAAALTGSGKLASERIEGAIEANRNLILGGASSWHSDEKGNIIFEATDGSSAMMLGGNGLMVSNSKDEYGDFIWRNAITGLGITADAIYTGVLIGKFIQAGSIEADRLAASVGQELEISSNKALMLYATANGSRPAGGLKTWVVNPDGSFTPVGENDSYIEIAAKQGDDPAYLNIMTGGILNIFAGSKMNIKSNGSLNVEADGVFSMKGKGDVTIGSGSNITVTADGTFSLSSTNLKINTTDYPNAVYVNGEIIAHTGNIAGFTIGSAGQGSSFRRYLYSGTSSLQDTSDGIYIGTDGVNFGGGRFVMSKTGDSFKLVAKAEDIYLGTKTPSNMTKGDSLAFITTKIENGLFSGATQRTGTWTAIKSSGYKIGDIWIDQDTGYRYICQKVSATPAQSDYVLCGTNMLQGSALAIDATAGKMRLEAANTIDIVAGATVNIAANKEVNVLTNGSIKLGNASKPFTVGAHLIGNVAQSHMYSGLITQRDLSEAVGTYKQGIYIGTDGINVGNIFKLKADDANGLEFTTTAKNIHLGTTTLEGEINTLNNGIDDAKKIAKGAKLDIDADAGTIDLKAANAITVQAASTVTINSGKTLTVSTDGSYVKVGKSGKEFTIGADGTDASSRAYMYYGKQSINNNSQNGVYIGTDGIAIGSISKTSGGTTTYSPAFKVTSAGDAEFAGKITSSSGLIGGWTIDVNKLYSGSTTNYVQLNTDPNNEYAMWAGNTAVASAPFWVKKDGTVYFKTGQIGPWIFTDKKFYHTLGVGMGVDKDVAASADVVFWAGSTTPASANFHVFRNGNVYAKGDIHATSLHIVDSNNEYQLIFSGGKLSMQSMSDDVASKTDVSDAETAAKDDTTEKLKNYIKTENAPGLISGRVWTMTTGGEIKNESGYSITSGGIDIKSTGALTINTTNFKLKSNGDAEFTGKITGSSFNNNSGTFELDTLGNLKCKSVRIASDRTSSITDPLIEFTRVGIIADNTFENGNLEYIVSLKNTRAAAGSRYYRASGFKMSGSGIYSFNKGYPWDSQWLNGPMSVFDASFDEVSDNTANIGMLADTTEEWPLIWAANKNKNPKTANFRVNQEGAVISETCVRAPRYKMDHTDDDLYLITGYDETSISFRNSTEIVRLYYKPDNANFVTLNLWTNQSSGGAASLVVKEVSGETSADKIILYNNGNIKTSGTLYVNVIADNGDGVVRIADKLIVASYHPDDTQSQYHYKEIEASAFTVKSSRTVKKDIAPMLSAGSIIDKLSPVSFKYKSDEKNKNHYGLILEDTEEILPEICTDGGIDYGSLTPVLLKEIQDLRKRVKELEKVKGER